MLEAGDRLEELRDLVGAQDDGELLLLLGAGDALQDPVLAEGDAVEEPQGAEGLVVVAPGGVLLLDEEEEVGADLGRPEALGRLAEVLGEGGDALDVDLDGPGAKLRSFMSSIIRWRSGVMTCSFAEVNGGKPPSSWLSGARDRHREVG